MKSKQKFNTNNKKVYKKPGLRIIELETDQVLVLGCKLDAGGNAPTNPNSCTTATFCAEAGS